ncbi:GH-E family nuclease [Mycolicibacterium phocaicum]|uniref:GH-E family nuclease n=1 Tax=Mycolicibacterium phocaicum TaxID=319706 RepID=UPI001CFA160E|nr:GH-E family nuclease [Mycolicibacterium phocaicum]UCZ59236.1 HNH/ENDO VII family nuclease [Mycolicibacterium phocaicum]
MVLTVALTAGGQYWFASSNRSGAVAAAAGSTAQEFADAAMAAFSGSTTVAIPNPAATPDQRAAGLPTDPVAGLTSMTPAGPVQQVLPDGLGAAQRTSSGSVVYPDRGAGFDFLAENTGTGTRTVARIASATGVRMVTTFVRTPVDTVMLAHTNGFLTINRATPAAETVGMFAPAETRDAAGKLVPSSYVARQLRPGLYQLSEVIDPRPDTKWPVYVDPPLHVGGSGGGPLPAGLFDSITSTVSSAANAVGSAVSSAASATASGGKAVFTFVKNNPVETAVIVAGAAVAVTGVGGPAGAAAIAAAVANVGAAGLQIASEAMPDNQTLGAMSTVANAATMFTPTGAAKKIAEEGAELAAKQVVTHTDEIIDAAKAVPNPAQVREEIAAAGTAGKPPLPGVETPKAPNGPPAGDVIPGGELSHALPPSAADQRLTTNITSRAPLRQGTKQDIHAAAERDPESGLPLDPNTYEPIKGTPDIGHKPGFEEKTTNDMATQYGLSRREKLEWSNDPSHYQLEARGPNRSHQFENPRSATSMYEDDYKDWLQKNMETNPRLAQDPTAQRRLANLQAQSRPTGAAEQRQAQEASVRQSTDGQRDAARQSADQAARGSGKQSSSEGHDGTGNGKSGKRKSNSKNKNKRKRKKSSQHH